MSFENLTGPTQLILNIPEHVWQDYVQMAFLLVLVSVGVPANVLSFIRALLNVRRCKNAKWSHIMHLKLHLAIADLLILFLYAASRAVWLVTLKWMAGDFFCKFFKFCHTFAVCCASYLVAVVAMNRLQTVSYCQQMANKKMHRNFKTMINITYVLAVIFSLPQFYVWETINPFEADPNWAQCVTIWAGQRINAVLHNVTSRHTFYSFYLAEKMYSVGNMLFTFYIPFLVIAISYCMVLYKFRRNIKRTQDDIVLENRRRTSSAACSIKRHSHCSTASKVDETSVHKMMQLLVVLKAPKLLEQKETRKFSYSLNTLVRAKNLAAKKAAYIIIAYLIFWCPYNILGLMSFIYPTYFTVTSLFRLLYDCIVINAVVNPFIYGI